MANKVICKTIVWSALAIGLAFGLIVGYDAGGLGSAIAFGLGGALVGAFVGLVLYQLAVYTIKLSPVIIGIALIVGVVYLIYASWNVRL